MDLCWGWDKRINGLSCSSLAVQSRVVVFWEPGIMAVCADKAAQERYWCFPMPESCCRALKKPLRADVTVL